VLHVSVENRDGFAAAQCTVIATRIAVAAGFSPCTDASTSPVMPELRSPSSCVLAVALALAACAPPSNGAQTPPDDDAPGVDARSAPPADAHGRPDAIDHDAAADSSPMIDAAGGHDASVGDDAGTPGGIVACYTTGNAGAVCTLPVHCCFTNYSSAHDGACSTAACTWGTIDCDGPEDCSGGQHCCAHVIEDPDSGIIGYALTCQSAACGPAPANQELCHPTSSPAGTCSGSGRTCVSALDHDNDLPRALSICQ
jgi:hypothetical protein